MSLVYGFCSKWMKHFNGKHTRFFVCEICFIKFLIYSLKKDNVMYYKGAILSLFFYVIFSAKCCQRKCVDEETNLAGLNIQRLEIVCWNYFVNKGNHSGYNAIIENSLFLRISCNVKFYVSLLLSSTFIYVSQSADREVLIRLID